MAKLFKKVKLRSVAVLFLIVYLSINLISSQFELMTKKQELDGLMQQEKRLLLEVQDTRRLLEDDDDKAYIERIARERLGYANPGEKVFIDIQSE
ncbi:MAG: septum formation initiator family protein [Oscillospiraceae bacterium]